MQDFLFLKLIPILFTIIFVLIIFAHIVLAELNIYGEKNKNKKLESLFRFTYLILQHPESFVIKKQSPTHKYNQAWHNFIRNILQLNTFCFSLSPSWDFIFNAFGTLIQSQ